jgi:alkylation response protein AidB-like acyl-CoA dehydrogenase
MPGIRMQATFDQRVDTRCFGAGVPRSAGGQGGDLWSAIDAIANVAERSMAAAWRLWAQRSAIEALMASTNGGLRDYRLPALLDGTAHGTTALASAAADLEPGTPLPLTGTDTGRGWRLQGDLPWVTNLPDDLYLIAVPVSLAGAQDYSVLLLSSEHDVLRRTPLDLPGLLGTHTVSVELRQVHFREDETLHDDGAAFMRQVRPALAALQCGVAIGMLRAALDSPDLRGSLRAEAKTIRLDANRCVASLGQMLDAERSQWRFDAALTIRSRLFELVQRAARLERRRFGNAAALLPRFEAMVR